MQIFSGNQTLVNRGDPAAADFAPGDFIKDGTWRELDLSSIVPAGAVFVLLGCLLKSNNTAGLVQFRKNGNSNGEVVGRQYTPVINIPICTQVLIALDADRKIEYNVSAFTWTYLHITVNAWVI